MAGGWSPSPRARRWRPSWVKPARTGRVTSRPRPAPRREHQAADRVDRSPVAAIRSSAGRRRRSAAPRELGHLPPVRRDLDAGATGKPLPRSGASLRATHLRSRPSPRDRPARRAGPRGRPAAAEKDVGAPELGQRGRQRERVLGYGLRHRPGPARSLEGRASTVDALVRHVQGTAGERGEGGHAVGRGNAVGARGAGLAGTPGDLSVPSVVSARPNPVTQVGAAEET